MRAGLIAAVVAIAGCGSSSGGPGEETNTYPGGAIMPIGGQPAGDGGPIPPPMPVLCAMNYPSNCGVTVDAGADVGADSNTDALGDAAVDRAVDGGDAGTDGGD